MKQFIDRRSFLIATAPLALGLRTIASAQVVERGRFGESETDLPQVRQQLLDAVNHERSAAGLTRLELDNLACEIGNAHATDMARGKFLSHWGSDGRKAYQRYSFAGGIDFVEENVSAADNVPSATTKSISTDLADMHLSMLNEVPPDDGHRLSILRPQNTHVGFGVALNERSLRLVELYVAKYARINPVPRQAKRRATIVLAGSVLNPKHFLQQVDICYEPLPSPPAIDWLRTPRSYALPEDHVTLRPKAPGGAIYSDGSSGDYDWNSDGTFRVLAKLTKDAPGIFTILFWIRRRAGEKAVPGATVCIQGE